MGCFQSKSRGGAYAEGGESSSGKKEYSWCAPSEATHTHTHTCMHT